MKEKRKARGSKGEGAKKKERRKRAAKALAAAGVIAGGTYAYIGGSQAYGEPVRFDNPPHGEAGHFHWSTAARYTGLDIALPAADQPGSYTAATAIEQWVQGANSRFYSYPSNGFGLKLQSTYHNSSQAFTLSFGSGDQIPNPNFPGVCSYYPDPFCLSSSGYLHYPGYGLIPEGVPTYLGAAAGSVDCAYYNNCQYGWIGVVRTGAELEAFAWGFESTPGVPINAGDPQPPPPTGACCDDATATCTEDVTQADCEAAESRWGDEGSECATIDPNCAFGACCGPWICQENTQVACDAMGGQFREGTTCEEAACNNIPTVSEWGLFAMSLGLLAAGAWVVRKRIPRAEAPAS